MQKTVFLLLALVGSVLAQTGNGTTGVVNGTTGNETSTTTTGNETSTTTTGAAATTGVSDTSSEEAAAALDGGAIFMIVFGSVSGLVILGGIGYLIYQQVAGGRSGYRPAP